MMGVLADLVRTAVSAGVGKLGAQDEQDMGVVELVWHPQIATSPSLVDPMHGLDVLPGHPGSIPPEQVTAGSHTGDTGHSEALEHGLEHMIMRKQEQLDTLARARRRHV
jgi:hypothetical protein